MNPKASSVSTLTSRSHINDKDQPPLAAPADSGWLKRSDRRATTNPVTKPQSAL
jgi:hypothetical protein